MRELVTLLLGLSLSIPLFGMGQGPIEATTTDGRQVILKSDGTWSYAPVAATKPSQTAKFVKSASARKRIDASFGQFAVWIDPKQWKQVKKDGGRITMSSSDGKAYALLVSEALPVPTAALRDVAIENLRQHDPEAHIVSEDTRLVNGREVLCLQIEATSEKIPFTYYGYYYGGSSGNVQLITYTTQPAFVLMKDALTEYLNGLEVSDTPLPAGSMPRHAPGIETVSFNDGKMSIAYDPAKWRVKTSGNEGDGKIKLYHVKGGGYAIVIPEGIAIPTDTLSDVALQNAKHADPDAKIVYREKRSVHGHEVLCLKIAATVSKIPFVYYGYYYGGEAGTVQLLTYTTPAAFAEYDADFTELLNSLTIQQGSKATAVGK